MYDKQNSISADETNIHTEHGQRDKQLVVKYCNKSLTFRKNLLKNQ